MQVKDKLYTVKEFEQILAEPVNQDRLLELINGEIFEKLPTEKHGRIVIRLSAKMYDHAEENNLGKVTTEARHQLPGDKDNSYIPDISFISGEREEVEEGAIPQMPDLAVEIQSPKQSPEILLEKIKGCLDKGGKMAWLFLTDEVVKVLRPGRETLTLTIEDTLDGEDILPGFSMSVREIFRGKK